MRNIDQLLTVNLIPRFCLFLLGGLDTGVFGQAYTDVVLFQDTFDQNVVNDGVADPSGRGFGSQNDAIVYDFGGCIDGAVSINSLNELQFQNTSVGGSTSAGGQINFRDATDVGSHFDWAADANIGSEYTISYTVTSTGGAHPLTFSISDVAKLGRYNSWNDDRDYDFAVGTYTHSVFLRYGQDDESYVDLAAIAPSAGSDMTVEIRISEAVPMGGVTNATLSMKLNNVDVNFASSGVPVYTLGIDFENTGRYFQFGTRDEYDGILDSFTVTSHMIPEPASVSLFVSILVVIMHLNRRRTY